MEYRKPQYLTDSQWLYDNLGREEVKIFDCTTFLVPDPDRMYRVESGKSTWDQGHIPGAGFIDLQEDLSDANSRLPFTVPAKEEFEEAVGPLGISNDSTVVLYSTTMPMWATRVWWLFRLFGHDKVSILNGGLAKWKADGRPLCEIPCGYSPENFTATFNEDLYADLDRVKAAIEDENTCIINSLSREQHRGEGTHYGRPGRIQGSKVLPAAELIDSETGMFLPPDELDKALSGIDALESPGVITYCGGGIAASTDLFALALMGKESGIALYDGSLSEWANTPDAPMESDV